MFSIFKKKKVIITTYPRPVTDCNKFVKILLKSLPHGIGTTYGVGTVLDYQWEVIQIGLTDYHVIGYHPVGARIDKILKNIVIH